ncbi:MAG: phosphate signaling complex protein PhoU [Thermaerobacter sp.]|nr:phosphate signaling complex protein PhoU [Thermaerobacter sp.]
MAFGDAYADSIHRLEEQAATMGQAASAMLRQALASLERRDPDLARQVLAGDDDIDAKDATMERDVLELISLLPPRQSDLRRLASLLRVARDLERVADYACDIAEVTLELSPPGGDALDLSPISALGGQVLSMLADALAALVASDTALARQVNRADDLVDAGYARIHQQLVAWMEHHPHQVREANQLVLVARYLERVADHAVNVAEMTVFTVEGRRRPFHHGGDPASPRVPTNPMGRKDGES